MVVLFTEKKRRTMLALSLYPATKILSFLRMVSMVNMEFHYMPKRQSTVMMIHKVDNKQFMKEMRKKVTF